MPPAKKSFGVRLQKVAHFLEVAYDVGGDDQSWLASVMEAARVVGGERGPAHGAIYDASNVTAFRPLALHATGFDERGMDVIMRGLGLITPQMVTRTFRSLLAGSIRSRGMPEMARFHDEMAAIGFPDAMGVNGLDPSGLGVYFALWTPDPDPAPAAEIELFRRLAHHLGAAYRLRRRLRQSQAERQAPDPVVGAEAILDTNMRVLHATGPAEGRSAQRDLVETAEARDKARTARAHVEESVRAWRPLTQARWTLVDNVEPGGARLIIARENQSRFQGLESLTDRERQVVAFLAVGQSTKETAYALGISAATVRVLIARAAGKLGVRTRAALLDHDDVRPLRPGTKVAV